MPFLHLDEVLAEARPIADLFLAANKRIYLVGGIVRDLWLDRPIADGLDLDLTTDALPRETKDIIGGHVDALWTQGERFGTIGASLAGRAFEITTHRSEQYDADSRKPEVQFATAIEEDLARRDFTVNAMALRLPDAELVDPHGGAIDLEAGRLDTPLDPQVSFDDDPLRMLRAARFIGGYGLTPTPRVVTAMAQLAPRLDIVSAERIRDELDKLLRITKPSSGLALLSEAGLLERFAPNIGSRFDAVDALVPNAATGEDLSALRLATLVAAYPETDPVVLLTRLRHGGDRIKWTKRLCNAVAAVRAGQVVDDPAVRRWWAAVEPAAGAAFAVAEAVGVDTTLVRERVEALASDLADLSVPLTGEDIMVLLDCEPGRYVGEAVDALREQRFARGPLTRDEAVSFLETWSQG